MGYEKRQFLYGMDFDTEERLIEQGFTRKNVNIRVGSSSTSGVFAAENIEGNVFIPNVQLPSGDNEVVGSYWFKQKNLVYYFVYNSDGNHGIYEYNHVESKIKTVMIAEVLNFSPDYLITGINVSEFDVDNYLLYWTDNFNSPRKININKAKNGIYQTPITEDIIDAIKYPPLFPPTARYENDPSIKNSFFNDQIWQFKAAYVYDDSEVSAYSPISVQILPPTNCLSDTQGNTIRIVIPKGGSLVERVIVAGREGNLEDFKEIEDKAASDYDVDADGNYILLFRNDSNYDSISLVESNKLFDNVPLLAKAQEYIEGNRIVYGNITEGFDNVNVKYDLDLDFEENISEAKNVITGYLRISNGGNIKGANYRSFQPIHNYKGNIVFGGFGQDRGSLFDADSFEENLSSDFKQSLPLGGFVIYLAGTDYYTITTQAFGNPGEANLQDSKGIYNSDDRRKRNTVRNAIEGSGSAPYTDTRVFSSFSFQDIPDGTYIMRVASNLTTEADLLSPDRSYQKTSTTTCRVGFSETRGYVQSFSKELKVTVSGGQVLNNIEVVVADLSNPDLFGRVTGLAGYLVDPADKVNFNPNNVFEVLAEKRIELGNITSFGSVFQPIYTDHNGFFFAASGGETRFSNLYVADQVNSFIGKNVAYPIFPDQGSFSQRSVSNSSFGTVLYLAVYNDNQDITDFGRTETVVTLLDSNNNPIKGISVTAENGDTDVTDSNGEANIVMYAPYPVINRPETTRRSGSFVFGVDSDCRVDFSPEEIPYSLYIASNGLTDADTTLFSATAIVSDLSNSSNLKLGGVYQYGIVYYDRANRSGTTQFVETSGDLTVPFYTEGYVDANQSLSFVNRPPIVNWEIKSLAPNWATHYQWVRTKNTALDNYIQWYTSSISYKDSFGNNSNPIDGTRVYLDITNLTSEYKTVNPDSVLVYDYSEGDRLRFIKDYSNNYFSEYIDVKVLGFENGNVIIENVASLPDISQGVMFEIYTPKLNEDQYLFYEIGEAFELDSVVDAQGNVLTYHKGRSQDQDPFNPSSVPAKGIFQSGDTYYRRRYIPSGVGFFNTTVDSQLFSDFWDSRISDIGRPNIIDKDSKRVNRPTTIYYSDRFVPETNINGLNSFYDTSFETYDRKYGSIQKLYSQDKRLDCYQELKIGSIMIDEDVTFTPDGNPIISYSDNVLSKINYYKGEYGTLNPESFAENEGRRYIFDIRNGAVLRLSTDGITPISDNKLHDYFESKSNFYSAFNIIPKVLGVFDENFDEYVISFGSVSRAEGFTPDDLALVSSQAQVVTEERNGLTYTFTIQYGANEQGVPTEFQIVRDLANGTYVITSTAGDISLDRQKILSIPPETLGFSEKTNHWTSFYTYYPEDMCRVGLDFLSFRNGQAYLHNYGDRNSFYGENSSSEVWVVFNQNPSNNKVFQALSEESTSVWEAYEIVTQNGQKTNLIVDDFRVPVGNPGDYLTSIENIHYAALWQDENTPNVSIPLLEGDSMRDVSVMVKLINGSTEYERLFAVNMNYSLSARSNR